MTHKAKNIKSNILRNALKSIDPTMARKVDNLMYISAKIKDIMNLKGIKNVDLANMLNKEPSVITKWLSGTHNFTINTISEIEEALHTSIIMEQPTQAILEVHHVEFIIEQPHAILDEIPTLQFGEFTSKYFAEA